MKAFDYADEAIEFYQPPIGKLGNLGFSTYGSGFIQEETILGRNYYRTLYRFVFHSLDKSIKDMEREVHLKLPEEYIEWFKHALFHRDKCVFYLVSPLFQLN
jgi:hypothetical protein